MLKQRKTEKSNWCRQQAVLPRAVRHWTLTTAGEIESKIGAKVVRHAPAGGLPDAELGGAVRPGTVPGHSGRDWAAEIARNGIRR